MGMGITRVATIATTAVIHLTERYLLHWAAVLLQRPPNYSIIGIITTATKPWG